MTRSCKALEGGMTSFCALLVASYDVTVCCSAALGLYSQRNIDAAQVTRQVTVRLRGWT